MLRNESRVDLRYTLTVITNKSIRVEEVLEITVASVSKIWPSHSRGNLNAGFRSKSISFTMNQALFRLSYNHTKARGKELVRLSRSMSQSESQGERKQKQKARRNLQ